MLHTISIQTDALLFDMDGVLIDSTPAVARVWTKWAHVHGFDPAEVVRRAQGRPSITTIRELLPDSDHHAENAKVERSEIEDLEGVVPLPGTVELLSQLPSERWAIVTSSTRPSSDVTHGKPHPEPYLKAADSLGFPSRNCIVIEDAPAGIKAGKGAGSRVIAFPTTVTVPELQRAGPNWIVENCGALTLQSVNARMEFQLHTKLDSIPFPARNG